MKNQLSLHEAIVIALININKQTFSATFEEIAEYIDNRKLYDQRIGNIDLLTQVMLRATKSANRYSYLFERVNTTTITLKHKSI